MLKAVIFDMDGVIIDSEPIHAEAVIQAAKKYGTDLTIEYVMSFVGSTEKHTLETIIRDYHLPTDYETFQQTHASCLQAMLEQQDYQAIPYVVNLMQDLWENKILIAIASSSPRKRIEMVIQKLDIQQYIKVYVSGTDVENPKPAPDIFLKTAKLLQVDPKDCVVIEDSYNGITAAAAAGMTRIGFLNTNSGNQDLSSVNFVIEGFEEITTKLVTQIYQRSKNLPVTIAETKRLILRELTIDDIKTMYAIYQSDEVREFIHDIDDYLDVMIEKHKAYIKNVYAFYGYGYWGVFHKTNQELIGRAGIQNSQIDGRTEIELGYLLDVNHWGFGYAVECIRAILNYAFHELHIPRIAAVIDKNNYRSRKTADLTGLKMEKNIIHAGRECYLYSIENERGRAES